MSFKKKNVLLLLIIAVLMLCLIACDVKTSTETASLAVPDPSKAVQESVVPDDDPISDLVPGEVELHEPILPLEFEEGEDVDNPYYKRTVNEDGIPSYLVKNATTGQPNYLPMGQTVIYAGDYESCFYERYTITYKQGDEYRSMTQYQLHVNAEVPPAASVEATQPIESVPTDG